MEEIKNKIKETYNTVTAPINKVRTIFSDYFGEELTDCSLVPEKEIRERLLDLTFSTIQNSCNISKGNEFVAITHNGLEYNIPTDSYERIIASKIKDLLSTEWAPLVKRLVNFEQLVKTLIESYSNYIIIRFPKVTVTNEYGNSTQITELYARIPISCTGKFNSYTFQLYRTEYTMDQYICGYSHSHMPDTTLTWQNPCLGKGPIIGTIEYLRCNFDEDRWGLFCYELSKYVSIESVSGGPYHYLANIGNYSPSSFLVRPDFTFNPDFPKRSSVIEFIIYMVNKMPMNFAYKNGYYVIGENITTFWLKLTKYFIRWANEQLQHINVTDYLAPYIIKNGDVYAITEREIQSINRVKDVGKHLFLFKNKSVRFNITGEATRKHILLLKKEIVSYIMTRIITIINYHYGDNSEIQTRVLYI